MLLVRGKERSWSAVPLVMELKAEGNVNNALTEAESYARGLRRNKMRLLTNADKAICVSINLNEQKKSYKISEVASKIKRNEEPIMQSLFNTVYSNEDTQNRMENLLGQVYYTFPSEQYTRDYLSRFLLGQLPLVKKPKKAKDIKVCLFNHSEADIQDRLTTYMIVIKEQINKSKIFIFHVQEAGSEKFKYNKYSFTEEILNKIGLKQGEIRQVTQVYVMGYGETGPSQSAPSPGTFYQNKNLVKVENKDSREYFEGTFSSQGRQTRSITSKNKFKGEVQLINPAPKLIDKFREAINYQQKGLREEIKGKEKELGRNDNKFELGAYKNLFDAVKELMCDENGKPKQSLVSIISSENRFKAFLDGLFTGLSDLDKDRVIAVLTEFQVGEGGRVDIMVQVVDNENPDEKKKMEELKESVSVGFELKYSETTKEVASEKLKEANNQIEGYARSQNIKSITEGDKVAFIGVVFNSNADKRDNLILVSEKFIVAGVPHSSIEIMGGQLSTSASEITLGVAKLGVNEPSTSREVR
ncbi:PD-(D/E)XK nuclease domain-containing protein [Wolbachia endosymbiont (group A) of Sicus ferrugineus]|uniref:PD-(D/E)XK nuclease domain-containing protein n=1 Tax=Wolbachia endosymbiont (group A) of Sicus ferrugineus TaxID=2954056 RepID=UPI0022302B71|nr:PD-(D/E)XK nuclease domain-containing protein [Wolbachia endosymbiont (group A) of Sicus ferrugineus]